MWIFIEFCSFLARLKGVIILKGMFPRSMGQYLFFVCCFLRYRFYIVWRRLLKPRSMDVPVVYVLVV